jgi:DNA-binding MarR family transcriptional regulator
VGLASIRHRALAVDLLDELGLAPGQDHVLLALERDGPQTQRRLAVACELSPPTITQVVRKLESAGLVARRPKPNDARATLVELTESGRKLIAPLKERLVRLAETTVAGLQETSAETLVAVTGDLARGLSTRARRQRLARRGIGSGSDDG